MARIRTHAIRALTGATASGLLALGMLAAVPLVGNTSVAGADTNTPGYCTQAGDTYQTLECNYSASMVRRVNLERNARGLPSLDEDPGAMDEAFVYARRMTHTLTPNPSWSPNCPVGSNPPTGTFCTTGAVFDEPGNGYNTDGSDGVHQAWMGATTDVKYMMAKGARSMGAGVFCSGGKAYVAEVFGFEVTRGTSNFFQTPDGYAQDTAQQGAIPTTPIDYGLGKGDPWFCPGQELPNGVVTGTGGQYDTPGQSSLPAPSPPPMTNPDLPPPGGGSGGGSPPSSYPPPQGDLGLTGHIVGMAGTPSGNGYWITDSTGSVESFGSAQFYTSAAGQRTHLNAPITHIVSTADGKGYWLVAADGGVFTYGDAPFYGSMGGSHLDAPVVDIAPTADGKGYWLVASDGGIFAYGDAGFHGSMGGKYLNEPVVGLAPDLATGGYWEVATDGGIFAFDAPFLGSMGGSHLNKPVNGMTATPDGGGYRLVASDGGLFSYGDAPFHGSMGGQPLVQPVVGMAEDATTSGYWEVASDGGIFAFDAPFYGSR